MLFACTHQQSCKTQVYDVLIVIQEKLTNQTIIFVHIEGICAAVISCYNSD